MSDQATAGDATHAVRGETVQAPLSVRVRVLGAPAQPAEWTLKEGRLIIGAAPGCDLIIEDPTVSRRHVELRLVAEGVSVRDLGSRNGTRYLGQRIESAILTPGSELMLGSVSLKLELSDLLDLPLANQGYRGLLGNSPSMLKLFAILQRLEGSLVSVLLEGESGTGKELVARAIHAGSAVSAGNFVAINCAALDRDLVKSELFGHRKGAFTGASETRAGAFELADGGTLFLDEIGELPLDVQPILLRALEAREVTRVGENLPRQVNVRVIAATNRNLDEARRGGSFREDLFFRLAVVRLELPSLSQRRQDIRLLAASFAQKAGGAVLPEDFLAQLEAQNWPGNARELRNAVEAYLAIGLLTQAAATGNELDGPLSSWVDPSRAYAEQKDALLAAFTRIYLQQLLEHTGGNQSEAARIAGLERSYLGKLASKLGVKR
ncbi:MAG: sigma 54-interacting transcriptional regulator [Polyangiaceae bacterium]|nr:sigma 54-interacting transcriptional regulator [Polyangiaceae bacterium]MCB9608053.1 sigma 54-interacting transcriptional regulator [Polyangiaceae bacterium]